ncbi:MAG: hypothetical protein KGL39_10285 [Patescibacteria group bacterium]|nr:hypothetical protein [Patescibacteria group bacterium]
MKSNQTQIRSRSPRRLHGVVQHRGVITRITIGRLYNLGSYEHERFEISAEVPKGASAAKTMLGLEKLIAALNPKCPIDRSNLRHNKMRLEMTDEQKARSFGEDWKRQCAALKVEVAKCEKALAAWQRAQETARKLFDDLGGASKWKDAKMDWDNDDDY